MKKNKPASDKKGGLSSYARYTSISFQMIAIMLLGVFGGMQLDKWLMTGFPVFTFVLTIVAVVLAIYSAIKDFLKNDK